MTRPNIGALLTRTAIAAAFGSALASAQLIPTTTFTADTQFSAVVILLTPDGPHIKTVQIPSQPFFLLLVNRSGIAATHISLTQNSPLASAAVADVAKELVGTDLTDGAQDRTTIINLKPGTYYLTVRENLDSVVKLVVDSASAVSQ